MSCLLSALSCLDDFCRNVAIAYLEVVHSSVTVTVARYRVSHIASSSGRSEFSGYTGEVEGNSGMRYEGSLGGSKERMNLVR